MNTYYYPKTIENVTTSLMNMWNDIVIKRFDDTGNEVKERKIPLSFGPMTKAYIAKLEQDSGQKFYQMLPRMSLVLNTIVYNGDRARGALEDRDWLDDELGLDANNEISSDFQPTPYDFIYTLNILTNSMVDFLQIVENFAPYFNKKGQLRLKEFQDINIERDLTVDIGEIPVEYEDQMADDDRRSISTSIPIVVHGWLYKPVSMAKIVSTINTRYLIGDLLNYDTSGNPISADNVLVANYNTSGANETSAFPPTGSYDLSGYTDSLSGTYWFSEKII
jgi:hypothetical protein